MRKVILVVGNCEEMLFDLFALLIISDICLENSFPLFFSVSGSMRKYIARSGLQ